MLMIRDSMPVGKRCRSSRGARCSRLWYYTKTGMKKQVELRSVNFSVGSPCRSDLHKLQLNKLRNSYFVFCTLPWGCYSAAGCRIKRHRLVFRVSRFLEKWQKWGCFVLEKRQKCAFFSWKSGKNGIVLRWKRGIDYA